jgi:hypothetical protein
MLSEGARKQKLNGLLRLSNRCGRPELAILTPVKPAPVDNPVRPPIQVRVLAPEPLWRSPEM